MRPDTYAPTEMTPLSVEPGEPEDDRAGPLLPAEDTNTMP
jgi:hypothetical protein